MLSCLLQMFSVCSGIRQFPSPPPLPSEPTSPVLSTERGTGKARPNSLIQQVHDSSHASVSITTGAHGSARYSFYRFIAGTETVPSTIKSLFIGALLVIATASAYYCALRLLSTHGQQKVRSRQPAVGLRAAGAFKGRARAQRQPGYVRTKLKSDSQLSPVQSEDSDD